MIRPSKPGDVAGILSLAEASGLFPPEHLEPLEGLLREFFQAGDAQERFWLTDDDDGVRGMVFCEPELMTNQTWNLRLIAVAPEHQGKGRGAGLLAHTEQFLAKRGGRLLVVDTSGTEEFDSVRRFYRRCGYSEATRIADFFDTGDDKITFTKPLRLKSEPARDGQPDPGVG